jgi:hypothetical protein
MFQEEQAKTADAKTFGAVGKTWFGKQRPYLSEVAR